MNEVSLGNASFTTSEQQIWNYLAQDSSTNSMRLVEVAGLSSYLSGNQLTFLLPGSADTIQAKGLYYQRSNDTTYTWWGEIVGQKGHISIASNIAGRLIQLTLNDKTYFFHPLSARYNAQVEQNAPSFIPQEPEMEPPPDITETPDCDIDDCKAIATVLVLVTPEAKDEILEKYQNLTSQQQALYATLYLSLGIISLNVALYNSGITGKTARFVVEEFDEFEYDPFGIIENDLDNLVSNVAAGAIFSANRADMMVLLTDSRYVTYSGYASAFYPAAIVAANYLGLPTLTFAHEIGHLLGVRHNRESNGGDEPDQNACNYGYRFLLSGIIPRYTIMAKMLETNAARILSYSNPRIEILDVPIGTGYSNNADYISKTFCPVADFYPDDELEVNISGPLSVSCPQSATYTIVIDPPGAGIPGAPPYSVSWMMGEAPYSTYQSSGSTFLGNSSSVIVNSQNISYDKFWLFVHILSSDGVMANDLIEVDIVPCAPFPLISSQTSNLANQSSALIVFPNPAEDRLTLLSTQPEANVQGNYFITNALGQILSAGDLSLKGENQQTEIRFNLASGIYTLHVCTEKDFASFKFLVQH